MSRFTGWTAKDIERINANKEAREIHEEIRDYNGMNSKLKGIVANKKTTPDYVGMISGALTMLGIAHEREYKFLHDRRFRFDIAIPRCKIAVEFEGGIYSNGAHTRGKHYASDCKKYNLANMHGWTLLRYTTEDTKELNWEFRVADEIKKLIEGNS